MQARRHISFLSFFRHLLAVLLLPVMATIVIPGLIFHASNPGIKQVLNLRMDWVFLIPGIILIAGGLLLIVTTIILFVRIGRGTLAPWSPTVHLVVKGPYQYVRNPMITGVFCILAGESAIFGSWRLLVWFFIFVLVNLIYMPLSEEPGLEKRFGEEYLLYKKHVPRWIPRLKPWKPA